MITCSFSFGPQKWTTLKVAAVTCNTLWRGVWQFLLLLARGIIIYLNNMLAICCICFVGVACNASLRGFGLAIMQCKSLCEKHSMCEGMKEVNKSKTEELLEPLGLAWVIAFIWLIEHDHDSSRQLLEYCDVWFTVCVCVCVWELYKQVPQYGQA